MDENAYNLVCKYCETDVKFTKFDDFLEHARNMHGPDIGVSAIAIVPEDSSVPCTRTNSAIIVIRDDDTASGRSKNCRRSNSHITISADGDFEPDVCPTCSKTISVISLDCTPSEVPTSRAASRAQTPFTIHSALSSVSTTLSALPTLCDLSSLKRPCLMEMIKLLGKCLCIWHKPSRKSMSRKDRFHAYQLLLRKLREFEPEAKFRDARNIVRQLVTNFFNRINGDNDDDDDETEDKREREKEKQKEREENALNPTNSKTVMERLMFLTQAEKQEVNELDISKLCSFCTLSFHSPEALFSHMLANHVPERSKEKSTLQPASSGDTSGNTRLISEYETDCYTDHSGSDWEHRSTRARTRRKNKSSSTREPHAKRSRRRTCDWNISCGETDVSNVDTDASVGGGKSPRFLKDYDDKFLEEFIELYRQQECLWRNNADTSRNRKQKLAAYDVLTTKYRQGRNVPTVSINKIRQFIRRLRSYYERLLKPQANPYRKHLWQRLAFIEEGRKRTRTPASGSELTSTSRHTIHDCAHCSKRFKRSHYLSSHMLRMHPPTACGQCSQKFGSADELKKHLLQQHQKANECPLCHGAAADWKSAQHLAEHFYDHICPSCSQTFHDGQTFVQHKVNCRVRGRFRCWHCTAVFSRTHEYRRHSQQQHQDYQPFKCDVCQKRYKYLAPLTRHQRWHQRTQKA